MSKKGLSCALCLAIAIYAIEWCAAPAGAQLAWDPGHTPVAPSGGSGTWDNFDANWVYPNSTYDEAWYSTQIAYFGGAPGLVTIYRSASAVGIEFDVSGYTIGAPGATVPLYGQGVLSITQTSTVTGINEIAAPLYAGAGQSDIQGGTLYLSNVNPSMPSYTHGMNFAIEAGATLRYDATAQASALKGAEILLKGGTLQVNAASSGQSMVETDNNLGIVTDSKIVLSGDACPVEFDGLGFAETLGEPNQITAHLDGPVGSTAHFLVTAPGYGKECIIDNNIDVYGGYLANSDRWLIKTGPGQLIFDRDGFDCRGSVVQVQQGSLTLLSIPNDLGPMPWATVKLDGGSLIVKSGGDNPYFANALNVTAAGGNLTVSAPTVTFDSSNLGGVSLTAALVIDTHPPDAPPTGAMLTLTGAITGTGSITKTGAGSLILDGVGSDYAGPTHVTGGTLYVTGSLASSPISIDSGASLGGTGTISSPVTILPGGSLALSQGSGISLAAPATLTLLGDVQFADATTKLILDLAGGTYDKVLFGGSMSLNGAELVLTSDASTASPALVGQQYWICDGVAGSNPVAGLLSYDGAALPNGAVFTAADGTEYQIQYNAPGDPNGTAYDVLLTPVPEMGSGVALLIVGAVGLLTRPPARIRARFLSGLP